MSATDINQEVNFTLMRRATYASVAVAAVLILIKIVAYFVTDSVSLLSSLIDSSLDLFASVINLFAVRQSLVPADDDHRFGHGKAEPLAGLGQAAFITGSSVFLCFEATQRLFNPVLVRQSEVGIAVMIISLIMTVGLVLYQRHVISRTFSLAIKADSIHYFSDIALNLAVIAALILGTTLGWIYADPLFAIGIAIFIIYSAWNILKQSLDQLMDKELPDEERENILIIAKKHPDVRDIHELRTRASGHAIFIQLHLEMNGDLSLDRAHDIAVEVQKDLELAYPHADVLIHQDPDRD